MEIRGKAWTAGNLEPFTTTTYVNSVVATDPIGTIESAYGRLTERLFKEKAVQRSLITYSMGPGEFDLIVKGVKGKALKEGREEAWDLARRIAAFGEDTYTWRQLDSVFGSQCDNTIFEMPVDEALAKDKEYREGKNTLRIGDEVEFVAPGRTKFKELHKGYVIGIDEESPRWVRILTKDNGSYCRSLEMCEKTGNHNPDIEKLMASFEKGEKDD